MIITPKTGYEHTVEAVNLQDDMVLITLGDVSGLAHIERYLNVDGTELAKSAVIMGAECRAEYKIGDKVFDVPLGSNMGEQLPGKVVQSDGEEKTW